MFNLKTYHIILDFGNSKLVNDFIYKYFRDKFYNYFRHIHCPSEFIANELKKHKYTAKLHIISNGVSEDFKINKQEKPLEYKGKFIITIVGRFSPEKRQELLIEAVKKSKYKDQIQLIFCGKGSKQKELEKRAKDLPNKAVFNFYSKKDLIKIFNITDLYVHTSNAEIEAISCLEAIATGLVPVISDSEESATKQFTIDERSLFKHGNSDDLANKIDYWILNDKERRKMEIEYANEVDKNYRIAKSIDEITEMFNGEILDCKQIRKIG